MLNEKFLCDYIPSRIVEGKSLEIKYYAYNPATGKKQRVIQRYNHLVGKMPKRDLMRHLNNIVREINKNLEEGKSPFVQNDMPKAYTLLKDAVEQFLRLKELEMRPDGMRSYRSYCKKIVDWITAKEKEKLFIVHFTPEMAVDFMNELALQPRIGNRTWNNHVIFYRTLWNWFIENYYCKNNIFSKFRKKREEEKLRVVISQPVHAKVMDYCREKMPVMEIVIDLVRCAFIRPKEICMIQIKHIDLFNRVITIPGENAKSHYSRFAYLPEWLCLKMVQVIPLDRLPEDYYLIASGLEPGTSRIGTRKLDKYWEKIRTETGISKDNQLYSYRDTGIDGLENRGVQRKVIQQLTGHKSEKMVGKYIHKPTQELMDSTMKLFPEDLQ